MVILPVIPIEGQRNKFLLPVDLPDGIRAPRTKYRTYCSKKRVPHTTDKNCDKPIFSISEGPNLNCDRVSVFGHWHTGAHRNASCVTSI